MTVLAPTIPPPSILQTFQLSKKYSGANALHEITISLEPREVVGLIGPNGAGKTTLLSLMAGVLYPSRGHVRVFGLDRWKQNFEVRRRSFFLPAEFPVGTTFCPFEYHKFVARIFGVEKGQFQSRLAQLASEMRMLEHLVQPWSQLSLGMQKKAGLIAAFLVPVELRFLDEPFAGGIDPFAMEMLFAWMDEARNRGETTIFSTQVLDQAEIVCDRVAMLDHGKLVALGRPEDLMLQAGVDAKSPRAFAQAFFRLTPASGGSSTDG